MLNGQKQRSTVRRKLWAADFSTNRRTEEAAARAFSVAARLHRPYAVGGAGCGRRVWRMAVEA